MDRPGQGQRSVLCRNNDYIFPWKQHGDPMQLSFGRAPIHGQMCPHAWFHTRLSVRQTVRKGKTVRQACLPTVYGSTVKSVTQAADPGCLTPLPGDSRSSESLRMSSISIEKEAGVQGQKPLSILAFL